MFAQLTGDVVDMRDFSKIIEQIKKEVPDDFPQRVRLFKALDSKVDSMNFAAPEVWGLIWGETGEILGLFLGEPNGLWRNKVVAIFSDSVDKNGDE